jgi:hypothetical protein
MAGNVASSPVPTAVMPTTAKTDGEVIPIFSASNEPCARLREAYFEVTRSL